MERVEVAVVGAGAVGLAVARELAGRVLEREGVFGRGRPADTRVDIAPIPVRTTRRSQTGRGPAKITTGQYTGPAPRVDSSHLLRRYKPAALMRTGEAVTLFAPSGQHGGHGMTGR